MLRRPYKQIKAFTLVELSIVIVIIGLIIGGVTAGVSLVKQAKINSVIQDIAKYKTAITTFKLQYDALPGDIKNAASYWSTCVDDGGNTCNGNGNRLITLSTGEPYRFWQHLALAGLIPGTYTGTYTVFWASTPGVNIPKTSLNKQVFFPRPNEPNMYGKPSASKHFFHFGTSDGAIPGALLAPDAYAFDTKIDDGKADSGWIGAEDAPCVTAIYTSPRSYQPDQIGYCRMFIYW